MNEKKYFSTCDVARIAKNCVEDTDASEMDVLVCVAKQLGIHWIAVSFNEVAESALDLASSTETADLSLVDDRVKGKVTVRYVRGVATVLRRILAIITGYLLDWMGAWPLVGAIVNILFDVEFVNITAKSKKDKDKDKEEKEICDCEPTGGDNRWYEQERDDKGRFLPR